MNILLINHYAGSNKHGMEYRPYYLAREWVRLGHTVSIIAASFSHLRSRIPNMTGSHCEEVIDGIRYLWLKTPRYQGNGFSRVINMMIFSLMLFIKKTLIVGSQKPALVIASSPHPFVIFGAWKIAREAKAKLFFEVRDLWPLTLIELGGVPRFHPFIKCMEWTEKFSYRVSDQVISLLPKADLYMQGKGMEKNKFFYIPNGVDVSEWRAGNRSSIGIHQIEVLDELKKGGNFILGYAGAHGIANALDNLIEAASIIQPYPIMIVLIGQGTEKESLQKRVANLRLRNVIFLPPIPKPLIPAVLEKMDAFYIGWQKQSLYRFGISPNKLMDYMMAGKPIIHAVQAGNDMVAESGCGISVPPEDPKAITEAVIKMINMTAAERKDMGLRGKEYVIAHHDYRVLAKCFIEASS
jgi:glycosyltransferase involved in cell wall biosynthesis